MKVFHTRHGVYSKEGKATCRVEDTIELQREVICPLQEHSVIGQGVGGEQAPEVTNHGFKKWGELILRMI